MEIKLKRNKFEDNYTLGTLYINDVYFCDTKEDKVRDFGNSTSFDKHIIETDLNSAIPYGTYNISVNFSSFFQRDLPILENVPYFKGVRLHAQVGLGDIVGCILIGINKNGTLTNGSKIESDLVNKIQTSTNVKITIC